MLIMLFLFFFRSTPTHSTTIHQCGSTCKLHTPPSSASAGPIFFSTAKPAVPPSPSGPAPATLRFTTAATGTAFHAHILPSKSLSDSPTPSPAPDTGRSVRAHTRPLTRRISLNSTPGGRGSIQPGERGVVQQLPDFSISTTPSPTCPQWPSAERL